MSEQWAPKDCLTMAAAIRQLGPPKSPHAAVASVYESIAALATGPVGIRRIRCRCTPGQWPCECEREEPDYVD